MARSSHKTFGMLSQQAFVEHMWQTNITNEIRRHHSTLYHHISQHLILFHDFFLYIFSFFFMASCLSCVGIDFTLWSGMPWLTRSASPFSDSARNNLVATCLTTPFCGHCSVPEMTKRNKINYFILLI